MRLIGKALRQLRYLLRPRRFDVVIVGRPYGDWQTNLRQGGLAWRGVRGVRSVALVRDGAPRPGKNRQFVIVFQINNILAAPRECWTLLPSRRAVRICNDKLQFADYAAKQGLAHLVPQTYARAEVAQFPCVVKRVDLASGIGIAVVRDADELREALADKPFAGEAFVLQAYVPGPEFTVHGIVAGGKFVWALAYAYADPGPLATRQPKQDEPTLPATLSAADRADLESPLMPLRYDGPVNVDCKRGPDGRLVVLEINPRFGSSLFWKQNVGDLSAALDALIAHAKWRPARRKR